MSDTPLADEVIDDLSIPVLTERIDLPRAEAQVPLPAEPSPAATSAEIAAGEAESALGAPAPQIDPSGELLPAVEVDAAAAPAPVQTIPADIEPGPRVLGSAVDAEMARTLAAAGETNEAAASEAQAEALRAAVLQRVAEKLPGQVNETVRALLQPSIDRAIAQLGEEAQVAMRIALQELVERAVREEMARQRDGGTAR
jgi:hypothetical protein